MLAYFGDTQAKLYQLQQWIPVLEELNETVPTAIFLRRPSAIEAVEEMTSLPVVYRGSFDHMISYYEQHKPKLFLYVNNGRSNFQTLSFAPPPPRAHRRIPYRISCTSDRCGHRGYVAYDDRRCAR